MSYRELARIYLEQHGLGEATVLTYFDYRPGRTVKHLTQELIWAEKDIRNIGPRYQLPEDHVVRHLRRVLVPKKGSPRAKG